MEKILNSRREFLKTSGIGASISVMGTKVTNAESSDVDIRHANSSISSTIRGETDSFQQVKSQMLNITADEPIDFGGDTGRSLRITNTETGRQVMLEPVEDTEAVSADRLRPDPAGEPDPNGIVSTELDAVGTDTELEVEVTGDTNPFPEKTFGYFKVELLDSTNSVISETEERIIGTGYQYDFEQDGSTIQITRDPGVDEDWEVGFLIAEDLSGFLSPNEAEDFILVDNNADDDTFEVDLTELNAPSGLYEWVFVIATAGTELDSNDDWSQYIIFPDDSGLPEVQVGNVDSPSVTIEDWNDLNDIRDGLDENYVLENDLDENTVGYDDIAGSVANGGQGFDPIGTLDNPFIGTFDGQGNEIRGLNIDRPDEDAVGLFGIISGGRTTPAVQQLTLKDSTITGSGDASEGGVGPLAGGVFGVRNIADIAVEGGDVAGTDRYVGGLIGSCWDASDVDISGSSTNIAVSHSGGDGRAGGLIGGAKSVHVENCSAAGIVDANGDRIGGLIGNAGGDLTVLDSKASGNVKSSGESEEADGDRVGGLVGYLQSGSNVIDSDASGDVTGTDDVGGLVGLTTFDSPTLVENCFAKGSVTSTEEDEFASVGGLIGENQGEVLNSYATGDVTGQSGGTRGDYVGGLIGDDYGDIRRCFAIGTIEGQDTVGGLVGSNSLVDGSTLDGVIKNCYATSNVQAAETSDSAGGLVGENNRSIEDSFATGTVTGGENVGGIVGFVGEDGTVIGSYWDTESTSQSTASGYRDSEEDATGLTTAEMQGEIAEENMSTLNFDEKWDVETNPDEYPLLTWQDEPVEQPEDEEVDLRNVTLGDNTIAGDGSTHSLSFDVFNLSPDDKPDKFTIQMPENVDIDSINDIEASKIDIIEEPDASKPLKFEVDPASPIEDPVTITVNLTLSGNSE